MRQTRPLVTTLVFLGALAMLTSAAHATTVRELARIRGQGESVLHGLGLVTGLNGTGDSGKELVVARPLAEVLRQLGNPVPDLEELRNGRSVALVMVTCVIPGTGARTDDRIDVKVSVMLGASSLAGGELMVAPLRAAVPGGSVYAVGQGTVTIGDEINPTVGSVASGARIIRDINTTPPMLGTFDLIIDPHFADWSAAAEIADNINQQYLLTTRRTGEQIAAPLDDRTIRVRIPENERSSPAGFVGDVLSTDVNSALLEMPAKVVCNTRTGVIIVGGDVQISPAIITHNDLVITTVNPPRAPDPANPAVEDERWAAVGTDTRPADRARLDDLMNALKQLAVPTRDQIEILRMLRRAGKLHAELIIE